MTRPRSTQRPLGETSGLTVPAVGMGTWQTLDVRGDEAERAGARDRAPRRSTPARGSSTPRRCTARPSASSARASGERRATRRSSRRRSGRPTTTRPSARCSARCGWYGGRVDLYQVHNLVALAGAPDAARARARPRARSSRSARRTTARRAFGELAQRHADRADLGDPDPLQPARARRRARDPAARRGARPRRRRDAPARRRRASSRARRTPPSSSRCARSASRRGARRCSSGC